MTTKRKNIHPYLSAELHSRFTQYCNQRGVTATSVVEEALSQYLEEKDDTASVLKQLQRQNRSIMRVDNQVGVLSEAFSLFLQYWFAHTPELHPEEKSAASLDAKRRYNDFVEFLVKRMGTGSRFSDEIIKESLHDGYELRDAAKE